MYYLLNFSKEDSKKDMWFNGTIYNNKQNVESNTFSDGKVLNGIPAPFTIVLDEKESATKNRKQKDKISTYAIESGFLMLVSPAAKALFEKLKINNLQYFDVSVQGSNVKVDDYKIVNITDKIDCVDFNASSLDLFSNGDIDMISSLVLDESKIPADKKIFLLGKRAAGVIVVRDDLKDAIESDGLTGFDFVELEDAGQLY